MIKSPLNRLRTDQADFDTRLHELSVWQQPKDLEQLSDTVRTMINQVRSQGDAALLAYIAEHEGVTASSLTELTLTSSDLQMAFERLDSKTREALELAAHRIREYHEHQKETSWDYQDQFGNLLGQRINPLERVGFYIPGGQANYPSSVLMTMIPAQVAGVEELIMISPAPGGLPNDSVLAAAALAGAHRCYTFGGAHAIAALAFGTASVPKVDKIVGPGGIYVTEAKRQVFGQVGIDLIAGPSEIMIVSDGSAPPEWLALDLLSQAEHDACAQALIVSPDAAHLDAVADAVTAHLAQMPRADIISASLRQHGAFIECQDLSAAVRLVNQIAPEHLELAVRDPESLLPGIRHAGAIFLGAGTPEVLGDYIAGPSHVLPTQGTVRFSSPLGVYDFVKRSSVMRINAAGLSALVEPAARLARAESLEAHAQAAEIRLQNANHGSESSAPSQPKL